MQSSNRSYFRRGNAGFTLAEIIIVIFIIAIATGAILLTTNSRSSSRSTDRVAKQLYAYLNVVREQAILQPAVLGVLFTHQAYVTFLLDQTEFQSQSWIDMKQDKRFWRPTPIAPEIKISVIVNSKQTYVPTNLQQFHEPQIHFMPSGEISEFDVLVEQRDVQQGYRIHGSFAGDISLTPLEYRNG